MLQWNRSRVAMILIAALLVIAGGFADVADAGGFADIVDLGSWGW
jgi:hypothetical protein